MRIDSSGPTIVVTGSERVSSPCLGRQEPEADDVEKGPVYVVAPLSSARAAAMARRTPSLSGPAVPSRPLRDPPVYRRPKAHCGDYAPVALVTKPAFINGLGDYRKVRHKSALDV